MGDTRDVGRKNRANSRVVGKPEVIAEFSLMEANHLQDRASRLRQGPEKGLWEAWDEVMRRLPASRKLEWVKDASKETNLLAFQ
jgi:hypothetical protein